LDISLIFYIHHLLNSLLFFSVFQRFILDTPPHIHEKLKNMLDKAIENFENIPDEEEGAIYGPLIPRLVDMEGVEYEVLDELKVSLCVCVCVCVFSYFMCVVSKFIFSGLCLLLIFLYFFLLFYAILINF
jgi:hypothetical protein